MLSVKSVRPISSVECRACTDFNHRDWETQEINDIAPGTTKHHKHDNDVVRMNSNKEINIKKKYENNKSSQ